MSRLPRRPPRLSSPRRGRSAAVPPFGQAPSGYMPVVRQRPSMSGRFIHKKAHKRAHPNLPPILLKLYKQWPGLFMALDQPWKWVVALGGLVILGIVIGSLL